MKQLIVILALLAPLPLAHAQQPLISKIAFGSCGNQTKPQPILDLVVQHKPDLFVYLGDNIYADTKEVNELQAKYNMLGAKPEFRNLKKNVPIIATWDDHDYGWNDIGRHYLLKKESKEIFLSFFNEPLRSERRQREGIYASYLFEGSPTRREGRRLQIILLDVRTFRDDLRPYRGELKKDEKFFYEPDYFPYETADSTLLGEEQWRWLEAELRKPADIRLIGSGSQFGISFNGYEAWANFPHEQKRMLELIKKTKASGVLLITGDVHYAEISRLTSEGLYPIYDATASGITETWKFATPNANRIEGPVMENHFGFITINWEAKDPTITMEIWDVRDNQRIEHTIRLSEISFK